jgi:hypothetical protein
MFVRRIHEPADYFLDEGYEIRRGTGASATIR